VGVDEGKPGTVRFMVHEVVTVNRRKGEKTNPHEYSAYVLGRAVKADLPPRLTLQPAIGGVLTIILPPLVWLLLPVARLLAAWWLLWLP